MERGDGPRGRPADLIVNVRASDLTLVDTNRLISTRKLAQLRAVGQPWTSSVGPSTHCFCAV
jgi:hypothetical protein